MSARNTFAATRRSHAILQRLKRGEGITIQEVSDEFGIQYPQARADLKLLEELYELDTYRNGRIKVWEMSGAGDKVAHVGMVAALELGGVALDIFRHTPYGESIDALRERQSQEVRKAAREKLRRLSMALVMRRTWLPVKPERILETLEVFLDSILLQHVVAVTYERSDAKIGEYLVIPRRLIWYQGRLWLQAIHDEQTKLFDVAGVLRARRSSMEGLVTTMVERRLEDGAYEHLPEEPLLVGAGDDMLEEGGETEGEQAEATEQSELSSRREQALQDVTAQIEQWFAYGSRAEEDAYFQSAFGIYADNYEPQKVELVVKDSWANYLRRYRLHSSQKNRELPEGLHVQFQVGLCPEFRSFLLGMIPDVEIIAPESLAESLEHRVRKWLSQQGN